jgi:hypothetical protein
VIWIVIGIAILIITIAGIVVWPLCIDPGERRKQREIAAIRAKSMRARYELDQAALGFHRALSDAIARAQRDRHS